MHVYLHFLYTYDPFTILSCSLTFTFLITPSFGAILCFFTFYLCTSLSPVSPFPFPSSSFCSTSPRFPFATRSSPSSFSFHYLFFASSTVSLLFSPVMNSSPCSSLYYSLILLSLFYTHPFQFPFPSRIFFCLISFPSLIYSLAFTIIASLSYGYSTGPFAGSFLPSASFHSPSLNLYPVFTLMLGIIFPPTTSLYLSTSPFVPSSYLITSSSPKHILSSSPYSSYPIITPRLAYSLSMPLPSRLVSFRPFLLPLLPFQFPFLPPLFFRPNSHSHAFTPSHPFCSSSPPPPSQDRSAI